MGLETSTRCRHGVLYYFPNDIYVGRSLELYGEFSEPEAALFGELLQPGAVVVEAGSNIGALTVPIARAAGSRGRVIAFEPQQALARLLERNVAANDLGNVTVKNAALGAYPGRIQVPALDYGATGNFGGLTIGRDEGYEVPVHRVDDLDLPRLDLIKADVEGMETEVVIGAAKAIRRFRPILYLENDRVENSPRLITTLQRLEYRMWWHFVPLFNPANHFRNPTNVFGDATSFNLFCVPIERPATISGGIEVSGPEDNWKLAAERRNPA
jgi:FkbM family methyltransferase